MKALDGGAVTELNTHCNAETCCLFELQSQCRNTITSLSTKVAHCNAETCSLFELQSHCRNSITSLGTKVAQIPLCQLMQPLEYIWFLLGSSFSKPPILLCFRQLLFQTSDTKNKFSSLATSDAHETILTTHKQHSLLSIIVKMVNLNIVALFHHDHCYTFLIFQIQDMHKSLCALH